MIARRGRREAAAVLRLAGRRGRALPPARGLVRKASEAHHHGARAGVIPFRLSEGDAAEAFAAWNRGRLLAPTRLTTRAGVDLVQGRFVPFFVYDAEVISEYSGEVGDTVFEPRVDARGKMQMTQRTVWRAVPPGRSHARHDAASEPEMMVYASYAYRRPLVQGLKRSPLGAAVEPWALRQGPESAWKDKAFDKFYMPEGASRQRVLERLQLIEQRRLEQEVLRVWKADRVRLDVTVHARLTRRAVYAAAYLVDYTHLGAGFRAVVDGHTGEVAGLAQYDAARVALAVGLPGAALAAATTFAELRAGAGGAAAVVAVPWVAYAVLPPLLAALASQAMPRVAQAWRERARLAEEQEDEERLRAHRESRRGAGGGSFARAWRAFTGGEGEGDEEERAHKRFDRQRARYENSYRRASGGGSAAGPARPPPGPTHYALLGVKPGATLGEIRAAFGKAAFREHPDVVKGGEEAKAQANKKFAKIVAAYQVLRDPGKRADYDRSIGLGGGAG